VEIKNKRSREDQEVVKFFLSKRKYGLPGSDGTLLSNYVRYVTNHDPLLAIFFTHKLNTYGPFKRLMLQVCIVGFTLWMNIWSSSGNNAQWVGVIISIIILQPIQVVLQQLATVEDPPCCLTVFRMCTDFFFYSIAFSFALIFWLIAAIGLYGLTSDSNIRNKLVANIFLSIFVSAAKVQILDVPNWLVSDWRDIPFMGGFNADFGIFDLFKCACLCATKGKVGRDEEISRCCRCCCNSNYCCAMFSQAGFWFLMGLAVGFPSSTYARHKEWFESHSEYRKGVVRVDDANLLILDEEALKDTSQLMTDGSKQEAEAAAAAPVPVYPPSSA
jgi:hypothetical protein